MIPHAPNEEAKKTAVQIRGLLFQALEAAIDNRWSDVREYVQGVDVLAEHCRQIEATYYREEEPE